MPFLAGTEQHFIEKTQDKNRNSTGTGGSPVLSAEEEMSSDSCGPTDAAVEIVAIMAPWSAKDDEGRAAPAPVRQGAPAVAATASTAVASAAPGAGLAGSAKPSPFDAFEKVRHIGAKGRDACPARRQAGRLIS